ncbi:MAG: YceI family protein [Candidatus Xenobia bacterium]
MRKLMWLVLLLSLVVPVYAASQTYVVNDPRDQMTWEGKAHGETIHGRTPQVKGQMTGNPQDITDHPQIQISADLASMQTGNGSRDSKMRSVLECDKYPTVTWTLKRLVTTSSKTLVDGTPVQMQAIGDCTLHGVTREVPVQVTVTPAGNTLHVAGTLAVNLNDYQVQVPRFLFFTMDPTINITLDFYGTRQ